MREHIDIYKNMHKREKETEPVERAERMTESRKKKRRIKHKNKRRDKKKKSGDNIS